MIDSAGIPTFVYECALYQACALAATIAELERDGDRPRELKRTRREYSRYMSELGLAEYWKGLQR